METIYLYKPNTATMVLRGPKPEAMREAVSLADRQGWKIAHNKAEWDQHYKTLQERDQPKKPTSE